MKLGKLGLAASAVVVMALAVTAHNARAQNFDDEGGRDRSWATNGQPADAPAPSAAAADSKTSAADTHSWKAGESATDADYNRRSHSLYRATAGTGVKTPPWAAPSDMKAATNNDGTVVKTDNGWAHQGTWKGPTEEKAAAPAADTNPSGGDAATNAVSAPNTPANSAPVAASAPTAPDNQTSGASTATDGPAPSMASPTQ